MAWLEIHQSLFTHRKVMALSDRLEIRELYVSAHLVALWAWALDNAPDGVLPPSAKTISKAAQWDGDPDLFLEALFEAGFLDEGADTQPIIHDWMDYAGKLLDRRKADTERKRASRFRANASSQDVPPTSATPSEDVQSVSSVSAQEVRRKSGGSPAEVRSYPTVPNPTVPDIEAKEKETLTHTTRKILRDESEQENEPQSPTLAIAPVEAQPPPSVSASVAPDSEGFKAFFEEFWQAYPARVGRKVGKAETQVEARRVPSRNWRAVIEAAHHYGGEVTYPVDPVRFFKSREYPRGLWRNYVAPAEEEAGVGDCEELFGDPTLRDKERRTNGNGHGHEQLAGGVRRLTEREQRDRQAFEEAFGVSMDDALGGGNGGTPARDPAGDVRGGKEPEQSARKWLGGEGRSDQLRLRSGSDSDPPS